MTDLLDAIEDHFDEERTKEVVGHIKSSPTYGNAYSRGAARTDVGARTGEQLASMEQLNAHSRPAYAPNIDVPLQKLVRFQEMAQAASTSVSVPVPIRSKQTSSMSKEELLQYPHTIEYINQAGMLVLARTGDENFAKAEQFLGAKIIGTGNRTGSLLKFNSSHTHKPSRFTMLMSNLETFIVPVSTAC
ncbi:hypothetical protein M422DRAFT_57134 [Sphaerobolus stellatus SS14]|uniref:Unplaced genomic scaffold SPHSTscaffold_974, whole genome shotgun sequence n=1 Tax=Sphaerobolus stellatus (strain SS14) TaxID=990650 RepID=A0A0C9U0W2_SPHS4|nr:hypothetical protein M422DRAFT_57134 [Sphaerobolus stellatus SS14]